MLTVQSLELSIGGSRILRGVEFEVPDNQCFCLMGRNGVGKTSTLRSITGVMKPSAGKITLAGKDITKLSSEARAAAGIGYVPQGRDIFPQLTVEENLHIGAIALGRKTNGSLDRVFSLFPILKEFLPRKGGMLSGGQQQQLAIGRALLTEPKILILDEPTEGIQPNIIDQIGEAIKLLRRGGHHNEAGLLATMSQTIKKAKEDESVPKSPLLDEAAETATVLLKEGIEKHPALFNRFAECIEALRKAQPTGTNLGDEIGSALKQLHGEAKMSILLVEQYLDFCKELADTFAIMDRGAVVCAGTVDALTDDVVKKYLTV
ncbi:MAG: ATP-binding cassette domain-containing protein [Chthoniobacter sp.]|uniref:ATP-binding cassette domain-containing protein n=1 Tax=Chthoniobacter sp. TaxID=2510640 RepID=UPI0032A2EEF1